MLFRTFALRITTQRNGMKLILLTCPEFFVEEDKILTTLFEEGLDILHLRKPNSEPVFCERLLSLMPEQYRSKIVVHDHFYLRDEFGLLGIHLSKRHPQAPASYKGPITRTCYDLQSVVEQKPLSEYVLLRNIFDSISESENKASFTPDELRTAARAGTIDRKHRTGTRMGIRRRGHQRRPLEPLRRPLTTRLQRPHRTFPQTEKSRRLTKIKDY